MSIFERTLPFASAGGKNLLISCFRLEKFVPVCVVEFVQSRAEGYKRAVKKH